MKKLSIYLLSIFAISFLFAEKALAVCPICTVAVGAGVGLSRWLGIDDTINWIMDRRAYCFYDYLDGKLAGKEKYPLQGQNFY